MNKQVTRREENKEGRTENKRDEKKNSKQDRLEKGRTEPTAKIREPS